MLENIKDGQADASKYNSEILKFSSPNVAVVFSNEYPEKKNSNQTDDAFSKLIKNIKEK